MGFAQKIDECKFDLMMTDANENTKIFDAVFNIIHDTDDLEKDLSNFMTEGAVLLRPIFELCHEEILMFVWNLKYKCLDIMPDKWFLFFYENCNKVCYKCSGDIFKYSVSSHQMYFNENDYELLQNVVFDINNYCVNCRRALYDILLDETEIFDRINKIKN
ncbi:unknown [Choristoneura occidentalis granulovirus]|uniref:Uncharacterized protein n=1 Tax=Choristoneura occidentalis granulovirus TaxID=364745 RepID=Q1A4J8_9BBAC|nr:unknown [Choristoneura fumiferana granulovirus]ABC61232.1 unknown [Choristoneura fumiferana granulovirus]